jgi:hypothetical protein
VHICECFYQVGDVGFLLSAGYDYVNDIGEDVSANLVL